MYINDARLITTLLSIIIGLIGVKLFRCVKGKDIYIKSYFNQPLLGLLAYEAMTAILVFFIAVKENSVFNIAMLCLLTRGLTILSHVDIRYHRLPDTLTLSLLWLGLLFNTYEGTASPDQAILGAVFGYLLLWVLYWGYWFMTQKEGVGYGDLKLLAAIGAWGGLDIIMPTLFTAAVLSSLICLPRLYWRNKSPQPNVFAFGPFLAVAGWGYVFMQL